MKKIIYLLMVLLILPLASSIEQNITSDSAKIVTGTEKIIGGQSNPNLVVATLRYEPYPVEQGKYFDLWLKIQNTGDEKADSMTVSIEPSSSFIYTGPELNTGAIPPGQYVIVNVKDIKVQPETPSGSQELRIVLNAGGGYSLEFKIVPLSIEVGSLQSSLQPNIYTVPSRVIPGEIFSLMINLENMVSSSARNVEVKIHPSSEFTLVGSTNEKRISWILPNKEKEVAFNLIADPDAESKPYKVPIEIYYYNDAGSLVSTGSNYTYETGILVESPISYDVGLEETKVGTYGQVGDIVISLSNTGPSEIKYTALELVPTNQYDVVQPSKSYIGNIDPDDFETVNFKIRTRTSRDIQLELKVDYKTAYNEDIEDTKYIILPIYSKSLAATYGLAQPSNGISYLITWLIIIALVYTFIKEWRRTRNVEEALKITLKKALKFVAGLIRGLHPRNLKTLPGRIKLKLKSFLK